MSNYILHVALNGCDAWSGLYPSPNAEGTDGPLASLKAAKEKVMLLKNAKRLSKSVDVLIHSGTYTLNEPLHFSNEELFEEGQQLSFINAGDCEVILQGGLTLTGFVPDEGNILKLDLSKYGLKGIQFKELYYQGVRQQMARYPKYDANNPYGGGFLYVPGKIVSQYENGHGKKDSFVCNDPKLKEWSKIDEVELFIFPRHNYTNSIVKLKNYNTITGEITLEESAFYEIYPGDRFYFRNVKEELTAPGEWYLDSEKDILYFYPPKDSLLEDLCVSIPLIDNLIVIEGKEEVPPNPFVEKIDWKDSGGFIHNAQRHIPQEMGYISFTGLTFQCSKGSAITVKNAKACVVKGNIIRNTGGVGVYIQNSLSCQISDNDIYDIGSHGVYISGGLRSPFTRKFLPSENEVVNNYIHHIGVIYKSVAGVALHGVGIRISNNYIHDAPRWGILSRGNDNIIEYNHIRHVNIETSDTSGIYLVDRDLTMHGTKIRYNCIHDVLGYHMNTEGRWLSPAFAFGIYLDDFTSGVEVTGNLIYRTPRAGIFVQAGQYVKVENNMFLENSYESCRISRWYDDWEYNALGTKQMAGRHNVFRCNIFASTQKTAYLHLVERCYDDQGNLNVSENTWENNLVWMPNSEVQIKTYGHVITKENFKSKDFTFEEWKYMGNDQNTLIADPKIQDIENEDFKLNQDSPAFKLGFESLPIEKMGPYQTKSRASWPIIDAEGIREHPILASQHE